VLRRPERLACVPKSTFFAAMTNKAVTGVLASAQKISLFQLKPPSLPHPRDDHGYCLKRAHFICAVPKAYPWLHPTRQLQYYQYVHMSVLATVGHLHLHIIPFPQVMPTAHTVSLAFPYFVCFNMCSDFRLLSPSNNLAPMPGARVAEPLPTPGAAEG
jgi:hypothetical protein